jgi:hypothetical protein
MAAIFGSCLCQVDLMKKDNPCDLLSMILLIITETCATSSYWRISSVEWEISYPQINISHTNLDGQNALQLAREREYVGMVDLLRRKQEELK